MVKATTTTPLSFLWRSGDLGMGTESSLLTCWKKIFFFFLNFFQSHFAAILYRLLFNFSLTLESHAKRRIIINFRQKNIVSIYLMMPIKFWFSLIISLGSIERADSRYIYPVSPPRLDVIHGRFNGGSAIHILIWAKNKNWFLYSLCDHCYYTDPTSLVRWGRYCLRVGISKGWAISLY